MSTTKAIPTSVTYKKVVNETDTVATIYRGFSLTSLTYKAQRDLPNYDIVDFRVPTKGDIYIRKDTMLQLTVKEVENELNFITPRSPRLIVTERAKLTRVIFEDPTEVKTYLKKGDVYTLPDHDKDYKGFYQAMEAQRVNKEFGRTMRWTRREETY